MSRTKFYQIIEWYLKNTLDKNFYMWYNIGISGEVYQIFLPVKQNNNSNSMLRIANRCKGYFIHIIGTIKNEKISNCNNRW